MRSVQLTVAKNRLSKLPDSIGNLQRLVRLDASNNQLQTLPAALANSASLEVCGSMCFLHVIIVSIFHLRRIVSMLTPTPLQMLYVGGNNISEFPEVPLCQMRGLRCLYFGANRLRYVPESIGGMTALELLYLGGNVIESVHPAIGQLSNLSLLYLGENRLQTLPSTVADLKRLRSMNLHNNAFRVLPTEILELTSLEQLALRGNPLVNDFANEAPSEVPSLLELCGRFIKNNRIAYDDHCVSPHLVEFLDSAKHCTNPACEGVYFTHHSKTVDFVDFCGKYRVPLLKYLCAQCPSNVPKSSTLQSANTERVLLTGYAEPPVEH